MNGARKVQRLASLAVALTTLLVICACGGGSAGGSGGGDSGGGDGDGGGGDGGGGGD